MPVRPPSVHLILESNQGRDLVAAHGRSLVRWAIQRTLEQERTSGQSLDAEARSRAISRHATLLRSPRLRPVINATGVVLHTNLGRAPLAPAAALAAAEIAVGYANLEIDLGSGVRGSRHDAVSAQLCHLTGAEAAAVVNNCAAATLLMLSALARGREVIVSRAEQVEIGGGFRMPEVMRLSGARMIEVGTTNRTRIADYEEAIGPRTAALLAVHPSNYRVVGFTETVELSELGRLARRHKLLLLNDLGSGALLDTRAFGLAPEPTIQEALEAGADVVVCSGDKLLGGPQAGLLLGSAGTLQRVLRHPLARTVRIDKMTLAALAVTLDLYLTSRTDELPLWSMLRASADALHNRAERCAARLRELGFAASLRPGESTVGGGSLPGSTLATTLIAVSRAGLTATRLLARLRGGAPAVVARIDDGVVAIDLRTVPPEEEETLLSAFRGAVA